MKDEYKLDDQTWTIHIPRYDTHHFFRGMQVEWSMAPDGSLVKLSPLRALARKIWRRLSRPFRVRHVVTAIDHEEGRVTVDRVRKWYHFL